jgi:hypothetical protein
LTWLASDTVSCMQHTYISSTPTLSKILLSFAWQNAASTSYDVRQWRGIFPNQEAYIRPPNWSSACAYHVSSAHWRHITYMRSSTQLYTHRPIRQRETIRFGGWPMEAVRFRAVTKKVIWSHAARRRRRSINFDLRRLSIMLNDSIDDLQSPPYGAIDMQQWSTNPIGLYMQLCSFVCLF